MLGYRICKTHETFYHLIFVFFFCVSIRTWKMWKLGLKLLHYVKNCIIHDILISFKKFPIFTSLYNCQSRMYIFQEDGVASS